MSADYVSSIYVLVPHFEGIIKDYLVAQVWILDIVSILAWMTFDGSYYPDVP